ncbi:metalloregulator ArsR/SmtB family transcription factor [Solwaraspora sp. WMMD1047]|uniref:ArsR/SmtB family transcription factor n=1 Tax=Solwaraspora sp. WMMD1047 TaxID=3016102 RepID=UPI003242D1AC
MSAMDAAANAIADPVRRRVLEALAEQPLTAGEIAALFPISRPAVSRHLRVLRESGLVTDQVVGRHRRYAIEPSVLRPLARWIAALDRATRWEPNLDALETEVHRTRRDRQRATTEPSRRSAIESARPSAAQSPPKPAAQSPRRPAVESVRPSAVEAQSQEKSA